MSQPKSIRYSIGYYSVCALIGAILPDKGFENPFSGFISHYIPYLNGISQNAYSQKLYVDFFDLALVTMLILIPPACISITAEVTPWRRVFFSGSQRAFEAIKIGLLLIIFGSMLYLFLFCQDAASIHHFLKRPPISEGVGATKDAAYQAFCRIAISSRGGLIICASGLMTGIFFSILLIYRGAINLWKTINTNII